MVTQIKLVVVVVKSPKSEIRTFTTAPRNHWIIVLLNYYLKHFWLTWTLFKVCGSGGSRGGAWGLGLPPPPLFLDQTKARRAEKKLFWHRPYPPPPLISGSGWPGPSPFPLIWRSGSATVWNCIYFSEEQGFDGKDPYYGIVNRENYWFRSYLNNRKQKVYINGVVSD